jgi:hypothetical protein
VQASKESISSEIFAWMTAGPCITQPGFSAPAQVADAEQRFMTSMASIVTDFCDSPAEVAKLRRISLGHGLHNHIDEPAVVDYMIKSGALQAHASDCQPCWLSA